MKPALRKIALALVVVLWIGACDVLNPAQISTPVSTAAVTAQPETLPTESTSLQTVPILIWLAPQFAPETVAGQLLATRLSEFESQYPNVRISVRVKSLSGPGGLREALEAATVAAPAVVPDLLTLAPDDIALAVESTLLAPLPEALINPENPGWYDYALPQIRVAGTSYGMPFASEIDILAYRTDLYPAPPRSWEALLAEPRTMIFPAADPRARFTLAMYLGAGGELTNDSGQLALDTDILEQVLTLFLSGRSANVIPLAVRQFNSPFETWAELKANRTASAMAPLADFLREGDPLRFAAIALPSEGGQGIGLSSTWSWCITPSDPDRQGLLLELMTWLTDPEFEGSFTHALGLLPTSQDALAGWPEDDNAALVSSLVTIAQPEPLRTLRTVIGPALQDAVEAVLGAGQDPAAAAQEAANSVATP
jgi:ABC-type glycerol-3-phosphate transport system substrate-binding protein